MRWSRTSYPVFLRFSKRRNRNTVCSDRANQSSDIRYMRSRPYAHSTAVDATSRRWSAATSHRSQRAARISRRWSRSQSPRQ